MRLDAFRWAGQSFRTCRRTRSWPANPAKIVRKRFSEEVEDEIRRSEWFLRPLSELIDEFEVLANPANQQTIGRLLSSRT
jgi:hypothetical protein